MWEYLYGYIRNTPTDTENACEHQLEGRKEDWPVEKNIKNRAKLGRSKELGEKNKRVLIGLAPHGGEVKQGGLTPERGNWVQIL